MSNRVRRVLSAVVALAACVALSNAALATNCPVNGGSVSTSIFTGTPTIVCPAGDDVIEVVFTMNLLTGTETVTELRCSSSSDPVVIQANGFTYVATVSTDWGDVNGGNCSAVRLRVQ